MRARMQNKMFNIAIKNQKCHFIRQWKRAEVATMLFAENSIWGVRIK